MIAIVDADLLSSGARFPNLALLKIAGYLHDNGVAFELLYTEDGVDLDRYEHVYMSKVFTFSADPAFYTSASAEHKAKFHIGGTGYYATMTGSAFRAARQADMVALEQDTYLLTLLNHRGGSRSHGIDMALQMPYYDLYAPFVAHRLALGESPSRLEAYRKFSMGFLTRRCIRHCPFCVNRLEREVIPYSPLDSFLDPARPYVYFWDDNFLAAPREVWRPILQDLIDRQIPMQFKQGLDERMLAESPYGEEMAEMLSRCRLLHDAIFAFDNWRDRDLIERALKIWRKYNPKRCTKFYLFTGFRQSADNKEGFYRDIWELFARIKVLMQHDCLGYVMRHDDYNRAPIPNLYTQIARWVNQPAFYKKMSFFQYCYRNQSLWEDAHLPILQRPALVTFEEFMHDYESGFYNGVSVLCKPLRTMMEVLDMFPEHRADLVDMFVGTKRAVSDNAATA